MSVKSYFLGIDVSTTAVKALLMDDTGRVIATAASEYGYETPHPLWCEQDPALWWSGTVAAVHQVMRPTDLGKSIVLPESVVGIGLTGQMHGLVLLDAAGEALRPAILWNDQRTAAQCDEMRARLGRENLIRITGNDALTGFTAPKILWVQQNEPQIWERTRHILLPKDCVRYRLTGECAMDAPAKLVGRNAGRAGHPRCISAAAVRGAVYHRRAHRRCRPDAGFDCGYTGGRRRR